MCFEIQYSLEIFLPPNQTLKNDFKILNSGLKSWKPPTICYLGVENSTFKTINVHMGFKRNENCMIKEESWYENFLIYWFKL